MIQKKIPAKTGIKAFLFNKGFIDFALIHLKFVAITGSENPTPPVVFCRSLCLQLFLFCCNTSSENNLKARLYFWWKSGRRNVFITANKTTYPPFNKSVAVNLCNDCSGCVLSTRDFILYPVHTDRPKV